MKIARHSFGNAETTSPRSGGLGGRSLIGLLLLASCASDDQSTNFSGDPITFTAAGIAAPTTRSTLDGDWYSANQYVAVKIGNEVKKYNLTVSSGGTTATLTPVDANNTFYWSSSTEENIVTAWYPYNDGSCDSWKVNPYQNEAYFYKYETDFLKTDETTITYAKRKETSLTFNHQVAKITIKVNINDLPSTASVSEATLKDVIGVPYGTEIEMYKNETETNTFEAIVTPQTPSSTTRVALTVGDLGTYVYTFGTLTTWEAAYNYTYNLTVSGSELVLTKSTIEGWDSDEATTDLGKITPDEALTIKNKYPDYNILDVSTLSDEVPDKTILTGTTTSVITIASGASVVLYNASVTSSSSSAIKCSDNATIHIEGENVAKTTAENYCGIEAGGEGTTLTIDGSGKLTATGGSSAAGIGCGRQSSCGNITIKSGTITAIASGYYGAGIGSGYINSSCGDITISGGTITATGAMGGAGIGSGCNSCSCGKINIDGGAITATGGLYSAGIGSGTTNSTCGDITINGGTITVTKGTNATNYIGAGYNSTCGTVTIDSNANITYK